MGVFSLTTPHPLSISWLTIKNPGRRKKKAIRTVVGFLRGMNLHKVFVYGTLKRGEPNHNWFSKDSTGHYRLICEAKTVDKYPLIIGTEYNIPFLLYSPGITSSQWIFVNSFQKSNFWVSFLNSGPVLLAPSRTCHLINYFKYLIDAYPLLIGDAYFAYQETVLTWGENCTRWTMQFSATWMF